MRWLKLFCIATICPLFETFLIVPQKTKMFTISNIKRNNENEIIDEKISIFKNITNPINNFISDGIKRHNHHCGYFVVKAISSLLPQADVISHKFLSASNSFINFILNIDDKFLSHSCKKKIILFSIRISQEGDKFGSKVLQHYYNIVENHLGMKDDDDDE